MAIDPAADVGTIPEFANVCPWKAFRCEMFGHGVTAGHMLRYGMDPWVGTADAVTAHAFAELGRP